ncbi:MAG: ABC transporter permease [Candidatus Tectomicrobia bacterium]|uniref:ABC transporter permease n=1 Tax=Tectimicrobiota bacterium TaxID=2528274 RepID=A0A932HVK1_UNCTE|nr:ABC transporter permease [Candidatus Tectomicrobia bacterium]
MAHIQGDAQRLDRPGPRPEKASSLRAHLAARRYLFLSALLFVAIIALWHLLPTSGLIHQIILPTPGAIAAVFPEVVGHALFLSHFSFTLFSILVGFILGSGIGFAMGVLFAFSELWRKTLYPYVMGFQSTPRVILAPLMIAWFGFGPESKIAQAVVGCFFPVFLNTLVGLSLVEENALKLMRSLRATPWQTFRMLRFPYAMPTIFAGLKVSLTFATIGVIVAEFVATEYGLGYELTRYHVELAIPQMYAIIIIIGLLGLALYLAIEWLDRKIVFWRAEDAEMSKLR